MDPLTGALIQGGASILSGILPGLFGGRGPSPRKQIQMQKDFMRWQTQQQPEQVRYLVKAAEENGFNPLTLLRGGGSAGFQQTHAPVLSMNEYEGSRIGDALAAGLQTGVQAAFDYDPLAEQKSKLEVQILEGQLRRINESSNVAEYTRLGNVPVATGMRNKSGKAALTQQAKPQQGQTTVTNPIGHGFEANPALVDAEAWETRYGDIAQEIGGVVNAVGDAYHNLRGMFARRSDNLRATGRKPVNQKGIWSTKTRPQYRTNEAW